MNRAAQRIVCLGWGSLIWNRGKLPLKSRWYTRGPGARVEFLRQSSDGRITLVLHGSAAPLPCLWALMRVDSVDGAVTALKWREDPENGRARVESWTRGAAAPALLQGLPEWADEKRVDAVVWTELGPKFDNEHGRVPSVDEVVSYLRGRQGKERSAAEEYVRFAPRQIDTLYRRRIIADLGWTPRDPPPRRRNRRSRK